MHTIVIWHLDVEGGLYFTDRTKAKKMAKYYREAFEDNTIRAKIRTITYDDPTQLVVDIFNHKVRR